MWLEVLSLDIKIYPVNVVREALSLDIKLYTVNVIRRIKSGYKKIKSECSFRMVSTLSGKTPLIVSDTWTPLAKILSPSAGFP